MTDSIFNRRGGGRRFRSRTAGATALVAVLAAALFVTLVGGAAAASRAVPLGTASRFAVLAGAGGAPGDRYEHVDAVGAARLRG